MYHISILQDDDYFQEKLIHYHNDFWELNLTTSPRYIFFFVLSIDQYLHTRDIKKKIANTLGIFKNR